MQVNMEKLCRVCLEEGASEELFSTDNSSSRYYEMVSSCTGISIIKNDGLPQRICVMCVREITRLYEFRSKCLKIDTWLRKILEDDNINGIEELKRLPVHREANESSKEYPAKTNDNAVNRIETRSRKASNNPKRPKHLQKNNRQSVSRSLKTLQEDVQHDDNDDDVIDCSSSDFDPLHFIPDEVGVNKDLNISKKTKRGHIATAFPCRKCELHFLSWKELSNHNNKHLATTQKEALSCRYCEHIFGHKRNMLPHFKQAHSEIRRFQCGYCGEKFKEFKQLRRHLMVHCPGDTVIDITVLQGDDKTEEENTATKQELYIKLEVPLLSTHFETKESYPPIIKTDILGSASVASERKENLPSCEDETNIGAINHKLNVADTLICYTCKQLFIDKETLEAHLIEEHETDNINSRNIRSGEENPTSFDKSGIIDNEKSEAEVQKIFACTYCNVQFNSYTDMSTHSFNCCQLDINTTMDVSKSSSANQSQSSKGDEPISIGSKSVVQEVRSESNISADSNRPIILYANDFEVPTDNSPETIDDNLKKHKKLKSHNDAATPLKKTKKKENLVEKEDALHCSMCGKRFKSKSELKRHETSHDPDKPYHCMIGRCRWSFGTESDLAIHTNVNHREDGEHRCDFCQKVFGHRHNLRQHMLQHQSTKRFTCTYCNKGFARLHHYKNHVRLHTKELPFLCQICGAAFPTKDRLKTHSNRHSDVRAFTCEQCNKTFVTALDLKYHKRRHSGERLHMCSVCGKTYTRRTLLNLHIESVHEKVTREAMAGKCKICSIVLPMAELNQHLKIHTCQYYCTLCPKSFPLTSALEAHIKTHSMGDRSHICGKCGSGFNRASHLRGHVARCHGGGASLPCPHCPNKFASKPDLTSHIRTHTGEKPYVCKECNKGFSQSHSLRVHMRTHTGEQPYICGSCHKAHRSASALSHHMRTHATVVPQPQAYETESTLQKTPFKSCPSTAISVIQNQHTNVLPSIGQTPVSPSLLLVEQQTYTTIESDITCQESDIVFADIAHDVIIKNEDVILYNA